MARRRINPNTAEVQSLEELPGIGRTLAANIVAARPYIELDDLESVKGLGKSKLARIKPYLSFEAGRQTSPTVNGSKEDETAAKSRRSKKAGAADGKVSVSAKSGSAGEKPAMVKTTSAQESGPVAQNLSRTATIWLVLAMGLFSVAFSVVSSLTTYYLINGALDFRRTQTIQSIDGLITTVNQDLSVLSGNVEQMNERLNTLAGLDGRMEVVEGQVEGLGTEIGGALETVESMQSNIDQLAEETAALSEDVGKFGQFVDGLRGLLIDLFE
jgi:hypothetical protein